MRRSNPLPGRGGQAGRRLHEAVRLHQAGALAQAEPLYRALLRQDPDHADAQNLLGLLLHQQGRDEQAVMALRRATMLRPMTAEYWRNLGMVLRAAKHLDEAVAACRQAVALQPGNAENHFSLGNTLAEAGEHAAAAEAFQATLKLQSRFLPARLNLAHSHLALKQPAEAEALLRSALLEAPGHGIALYNLALALQAQQRWPEAEEAFQAAAQAGQDSAALFLNRGLVLQELERWNEALSAYQEALSRRPEMAEAWFGLGLCLQSAGADAARLSEAEKAFEQAIALRSDYCDAFYNLAHVRQRLGDLESGREALGQALALRPDDPHALTNLAHVLAMQGWPEQALPLAERAHALAPEDPLPRANYGRMLLLAGHYAEGWEACRVRAHGQDATRHDFDLPEWNGETLPTPGRILIWREQGIGDELMFCSVLPDLLAAGHRATVLCDPRLEPALARAFPQLAFLHEGRPGPEIHAQIAMGDLPRLFRRSESAFGKQRPFLTADPALRQSLRDRYADGRRLIGLSWRTSNTHSGQRRSIMLEQFAPLFTLPGTRWISLQYGAPSELRAEAEAWPLFVDDEIDVRASIEQALAQVAAMDHVVTIDNSTVHLAGALGVACDLLLPLAPDWRWQTGRSDTPWYPTVRLWRCDHRRKWRDVVGDLRKSLSISLESQNLNFSAQSLKGGTDQSCSGISCNAKNGHRCPPEQAAVPR